MKYFFGFIFLFWDLTLSGQVSFTKGNHALELSGIINSYFGWNDVKDNPNQYGYNLRDVRFIINGEQHPRFQYQFMVDLADISKNNDANQFLLDAFLNIDFPNQWDLYIGYQRLPFSRNSNVSTFNSVFSERPDISDGSLFYRRDLGVIVRKKGFDQHINMQAGIFNGDGSLEIGEEKDGGLVYVGRIDFTFPGRIKYEEVDIRHSPLPLFSVGLNVLYTSQNREKEQDLFPLMVDGRKKVLGMDAHFAFRGWTVQGEWTNGWVDRNISTSPSLPVSLESHGFHLSTNYYFKNARSVVALRYEQYNPNNSVHTSDLQALTLGYNYLVDQSQDVVFRADWRFLLSDKEAIPGLEQIISRVGMQFRF